MDRDALLNVLSDPAIITLHEKVMALDFVTLVRCIRSLRLERTQSETFDSAWRSIEGSPPGVLKAALRDPAFACWISAGKSLQQKQLFERYPDAHPGRHLKELGHLALAWAGGSANGSSAVLYSMGRTEIALNYGLAALVKERADPTDVVCWEKHDGIVTVRDAEGGMSLRLTSAGVVIDSDGCQWRELPTVHGIPVLDSASTRNYVPAPHLDTRCEQLIKTYLRGIRFTPHPEPWVAGVANITGASLTDDILLERTLADRIQRLFHVGPLCGATVDFGPDGNDLRDVFARAGARYQRAVLTGVPLPSVEMDDADAQMFELLVRQMSSTGEGLRFLRVAGLCAEPHVEHRGFSVQEQTPATQESLPPTRGVLRKTRRVESYRTLDWSLLEEMAKGGDTSADSACSVSGDRTNEEETYTAAVRAYVSRDFREAMALLIDCIHSDSDVEEYWTLLGFCLRHLGNRTASDGLLFGSVRDLHVLRTLVAV